jgi:hypothetical protein
MHHFLRFLSLDVFYFQTDLHVAGLSFADLQTFDQYFRTPGQATLVLRPHASATTRASVFVRRADGPVNAGTTGRAGCGEVRRA